MSERTKATAIECAGFVERVDFRRSRSGRRLWSTEQKGRIVRESLAPRGSCRRRGAQIRLTLAAADTLAPRSALGAFCARRRRRSQKDRAEDRDHRRQGSAASGEGRRIDAHRRDRGGVGTQRMIIPAQGLRIVLAVRPVDFRCGHDALAALVQNTLGLDPHSGLIVVFRSKRKD
jgi:transposase